MALEFATNGASSNSTLVFGENFPLLDLPGFAIDIIIDILDKIENQIEISKIRIHTQRLGGSIGACVGSIDGFCHTSKFGTFSTEEK